MPSGMKVLASSAGQSLPVVPWIAVLDSNVTATAQEGLYVVHLYWPDLSRLYLSMNQGATQHQRNAGEAGLAGVARDRAALAELRADAALLRKHLSDKVSAGLKEAIESGLIKAAASSVKAKPKLSPSPRRSVPRLPQSTVPR